jgi:hypothetical protein
MTRFFMTRGQRSTKQRNEYSPDFVSRGQKMNTRSHLSAFSCSSARAIRSAVETILIFIVRRPESISPQEAVEHAKEDVRFGLPCTIDLNKQAIQPIRFRRIFHGFCEREPAHNTGNVSFIRRKLDENDRADRRHHRFAIPSRRIFEHLFYRPRKASHAYTTTESRL